MANQSESAQELLLDVKVAEASKLYKLYLKHEKKILGTAAVTVFLVVWELVGNVLQIINPMFMSAPSLILSSRRRAIFHRRDLQRPLYQRHGTGRGLFTFGHCGYPLWHHDRLV